MGSDYLERKALQDLEEKWAAPLRQGLTGFLGGSCTTLDAEHTLNTPVRVVESLMELTSGMKQDPIKILGTKFRTESDQMVTRTGIRVVSTCAHHLLPFIGKAHFAYLPKDHIVGLSKIPRLVQAFSKRLQVQEELTAQIVDAFQDIVEPHGCGLCIRAYHLCELVRGVKEHSALTMTLALRGSFHKESTKAEFIHGINMSETVFP